MLRPSRLVLKGFRSFEEEAVFEFKENDFVLISGHSTTGSQSGTGKSSVLMAMAFALGIKDLPATELKNWRSKSLSVELTLVDGSKTYKVTRDPKLQLEVDGVKYAGTSDGAEKELKDVILKTPIELVKTLVYRPQKTQGVFLGSADAYRKEFLSTLLGLGKIDEAHDHFKDQVKIQDASCVSLAREVQSMELTLSTMPPVEEQELEKAKQVYDDLSLKAKGSNTETEKQKLQLEIGQANAELNRVYLMESSLSRANHENSIIKNQVLQINQEIDKLKSQTCPTCFREWDKAQGLLDKRKTDISALLDKMKANMAVIRSAEPVIANKKLFSDMVAELNGKLGALARPEMEIKQSLATAASYYTNLIQRWKSRSELAKRIEETRVKLSVAQVALVKMTHCATLLSNSGFLGSVFDEILAEIEIKINNLLPEIPNVSSFTVKVSSEQTTKASKVNKEIGVVLYKDGNPVSLRAMSGGQRTSLDLCTDLAVSETIRSRFGSNFGWVALDEAMDGLDSDTKKTMLEVIRKNVNGLIIVVDHSTEIKELFGSVVDIKYDGRESRVV